MDKKQLAIFNENLKRMLPDTEAEQMPKKNKNYVVILLFTKDYEKVLLVKRNKPPYENLWNGIGGKIELDETPLEAAIRECSEETGIIIKSPKLLVTYVYPYSNPVNSGTHLSVIYDFIDEVEVEDNYEGHYEWKDVNFALDFNSKEIAGCSNLAQMIKEIYDIEDIKKFY